MPVMSPGVVPSKQMGTRDWSRFCSQKPVYEIVTVTTTTFTAAREELILVDDDTAGAGVTITIPPVRTSKGLQYIVKKLGTTGNVTIDGTDSETIDGATTLVLSTQYGKAHIVCTGTEWITI